MLNQISNEVLKVIMLAINDYLAHIFNIFLFIGYYPLHFNKLIVIIYCKLGGAKDYISQKSYWLISLLNILGNIIKLMLVTKIRYMTITRHLLLKTHFESHLESYIEIVIYHL